MLIVDKYGRTKEVSDELTNELEDNTNESNEKIRLFSDNNINGIEVYGYIEDENVAYIEPSAINHIKREQGENDKEKRHIVDGQIEYDATTIILPLAQYNKIIEEINSSNKTIKVDIFHNKLDEKTKLSRERLLREQKKLASIAEALQKEQKSKIEYDISEYLNNKSRKM